jgi:hypothetical protein
VGPRIVRSEREKSVIGGIGKRKRVNTQIFSRAYRRFHRMKIRIEYSRHKTHPIQIWYPYGRGESFEELTVEQAKEFRRKLNRVIAIVEDS